MIYEGEPSKRYSPVLPGFLPACGESGGCPSAWGVSRLSSNKWLSRQAQRWGTVWAEPRACRPQRAWVRVFSRTMEASVACRALPHASWDSSCTSRKPQLLRWLGIIKRCWAPLYFLANQRRKRLHPPGLSCHCGNRSPERGRCKHPADAGRPGCGWWPPPDGIILTNLRARGWSAVRSSAQNILKQGLAKMISEAATGKEVGGWNPSDH